MALDVLRLMQATDALRNRNEVAEYSALAAEAALPGEAVAAIAAAKRAGIVKAGDSPLAERLKAQGERAGDAESPIGAYANKSATPSNPQVAGATGTGLAGHGRPRTE